MDASEEEPIEPSFDQDEKKKYLCPVRQHDTVLKKDMLDHYSRKHAQSHHKCEEESCDEVFQNKWDYEWHKDEKHKPAKCINCGGKFKI